MQNDNPFFRRFSTNRSHSNRWRRWLGAAVGLIALAILIYNVPFVHDRLAWRIDDLRSSIIYFLRPPQQAVFVPEENQIAIASGTAAASTPRATNTPLPASATPLPTEPPIPNSTQLSGFKYVDQTGGWNLCGPATLAVALSFWGWDGTKYDVSNYVKPGPVGISDFVERSKPDKNVMPYELEDFVDTQVPGFQAAYRVGGDLERIKRFIAAGFPVIVEKNSYCNPGPTWCGHYVFVTGYDDAKQEFTVQDTYLKEANLTESYDEFLAQWRGFNYLFFVIYPDERLNEVIQLLGPWNDEQWAIAHALEIAKEETTTLTSDAQFYAWFNVGTSHVGLYEYVDAAFAYDQAFQLYAELPLDENLPFRMMWYQTGPYWAYYYSGRYNDVINLANTTLNAEAISLESGVITMDPSTLEESLYWRALARLALGETDNAIADLQEAVRINPSFQAGIQQLSALGISG